MLRMARSSCVCGAHSYCDSLSARLRRFHFVQQRNRIIFSRDLTFALRIKQELVFPAAILSGSLPGLYQGRGTNVSPIQLAVF
jgi:hypothetical protein